MSHTLFLAKNLVLNMKKKEFLLGIVSLCFVVLSTNMFSTRVQGHIPGNPPGPILSEPPRYYCDLIEGRYCDIDSDSEDDDLSILADLYTFDPLVYFEIYMIMELVIEYPSGQSIEFTWDVFIYEIKDYSLEFQVIDGALEAGWYDVHLYIYDPMCHWMDYDYITFDPPHNKGNSEPVCDVIVF